ncbi:Uncharacterised protein [Vibrio cholerae]|nr:Uncharacterised protein [Vibrio cholerae]
MRVVGITDRSDRQIRLIHRAIHQDLPFFDLQILSK